MEKYARRQGFDPLIPENWYAQPIRKIMLIKVIIIYFFISLLFCDSFISFCYCLLTEIQ